MANEKMIPATPEEIRYLREAIGAKVSIIAPNAPTEEHSDQRAGIHYNDVDLESKKNFDQKIYMFPESFNALRRELFENWPTLWALVGWRMAHRAEEFCDFMNGALDLNLVVNSQTVDYICKQYLNALRKKRGLGAL